MYRNRVGCDGEAPHLVSQDDLEVLEIWNIVFIEFNKETTGEITFELSFAVF